MPSIDSLLLYSSEEPDMCSPKPAMGLDLLRNICWQEEASDWFDTGKSVGFRCDESFSGLFPITVSLALHQAQALCAHLWAFVFIEINYLLKQEHFTEDLLIGFFYVQKNGCVMKCFS